MRQWMELTPDPAAQEVLANLIHKTITAEHGDCPDVDCGALCWGIAQRIVAAGYLHWSQVKLPGGDGS